MEETRKDDSCCFRGCGEQVCTTRTDLVACNLADVRGVLVAVSLVQPHLSGHVTDRPSEFPGVGEASGTRLTVSARNTPHRPAVAHQPGQTLETRSAKAFIKAADQEMHVLWVLVIGVRHCKGLKLRQSKGLMYLYPSSWGDVSFYTCGHL